MRRVTRRSVVAALAGLTAGCLGGGADGGATTTPVPESELSLTSPAFADGDPIPDQYGYHEANVNPPLHVGGVPGDAASLALVVDDPDAPNGTWTHWLVWNVAASRTEIPEDWTPADAVEGSNSWGEVGYGGPAPPDSRHTYRFDLYALDASLPLERGADRAAFDDALGDRVLGHARLTGTYAP